MVYTISLLKNRSNFFGAELSKMNSGESSQPGPSKRKLASAQAKAFWKSVPWKPEKTICTVLAKQIINSMPQRCPNPGKLLTGIYFFVQKLYGIFVVHKKKWFYELSCRSAHNKCL